MLHFLLCDSFKKSETIRVPFYLFIKLQKQSEFATGISATASCQDTLLLSRGLERHMIDVGVACQPSWDASSLYDAFCLYSL